MDIEFKEQQKRFILWLKTNKNLSEQTLRKYTEEILFKLKEIIETTNLPEVKNLDFNLYSYKTIAEFNNFEKILKSAPEFDIINRTGLPQSGWVSTPLNHYKKFLSSNDNLVNPVDNSYLTELILKYKFKKYSQEYSEQYKFNFFNKFKGIFNDLEDLDEKIKSLGSENFMPYIWKTSVFRVLAFEYNQEFKSILLNLFDDNENLTHRIDIFRKSIKNLLLSASDWNNKQMVDVGIESASFFLALYNPEKYLLYTRIKPYNNFSKQLSLGLDNIQGNNRYEAWLNYCQKTLLPALKSIIGSDSNLLTCQDFIWCLFQKKEEDNKNNENDSNINEVIMNDRIKPNFSLNQILYGPPGTGKTYHTDEYIREIIKNNVESDNANSLDIYEGLTWYSVIALAMYKHKKDSYKVPELKEFEEIQQFSNNKDNSRILSQILWGQLQYHTAPDNKFVKYEKRHTPYIFEKMEHSNWRLTQEGKEFVEEQLSEYLDYKNTNKKEYSTFITFHQSYSYEEFVEGIKPQINSTDQENSDGEIIYKYSDGIFKDICKRANADPQNNYIIVIDEINRGNISKIFGELITLIEDDKRVTPNGESTFKNTKKIGNELIVKLPYSKESFAVPKNLYIIGTMNTSDRSIASIDIALRRRFKFVEMMPNASLVSDFGCNFSHTFKILNRKISILLDRDHQIGHSYFINTKFNTAKVEELKEIWFNSIMPLLNEYFYGDWEKLKLVIPGFIKSNQIPECLKNECDEDVYYEFKTKDDFGNDQVFVTALNQESFVKEDRQ